MMWKFPLYTVGQSIDWVALEERYAWFGDMRNVPQDIWWHGEGDVFTHTKMMVEALVSLEKFQQLEDQQKHILFAAAMLHDVEKRSTTTKEVIDGLERIVSPGHAKKGEYTARNLLYTEILTPFSIREQICKLVRLHGLPLWAIEKDDPVKAVVACSLEVDTRMLALLATADILGRVCNDQEEILVRIGLFEALCEEHQCFGKPRIFTSDYGRFLYLNKADTAIDYEPYDDLRFTVHMICALPGTGKDTYIGVATTYRFCPWMISAEQTEYHQPIKEQTAG
ncbi:MAG: HD domain-containing protein [Cyclobacteriaceae bacterium]